VSDTPRTDAAVRDVDVAFVGHWGLSSEPQEFVSPEFTRELERENAELREDKEILDWMEKNVWAINFKYKPDVFSMDIREIIRDEIAKEDKP